MAEPTEAETIEAIQLWISEDPSRLPYVQDVWWIAIARGAHWAIANASQDPVPSTPFHG